MLLLSPSPAPPPARRGLARRRATALATALAVGALGSVFGAGLGAVPGSRCAAAQAPRPDPGGGRRPRGLGDSVVGTVSDATTGRPLPRADVAGAPAPREVVALDAAGRPAIDTVVEPPRAWTDTAGRFVLRGLRRGRQVVTIQTSGYRAACRTVVAPGGAHPGAAQPAVLTVALRRGPPPGVSLAGTWAVELVVDSSSPRQPPVRPGRGTLALHDTADAPGRADPPRWRPAAGTLAGGLPFPDVDRSAPGVAVPLESAAVAPRAGAGAVPPRQPASDPVPVVGAVFFGDSVRLRIGYGATHGDVACWGRLVGDVASGRWWRTAGPGGVATFGHFALRRTRGSAGGRP